MLHSVGLPKSDASQLKFACEVGIPLFGVVIRMLP